MAEKTQNHTVIRKGIVDREVLWLYPTISGSMLSCTIQYTDETFPPLNLRFMICPSMPIMLVIVRNSEHLVERDNKLHRMVHD